MKKELVSVVFDRKKRLETTGEGKVEICVYLSRTERKFITVSTCNAISWKKYEKSAELRDKVLAYQHIVNNMQKNGEEMTIARPPLRWRSKKGHHDGSPQHQQLFGASETSKFQRQSR